VLYDLDDPPLRPSWYPDPGLGMTGGFVRGHTAGDELPSSPYPYRPGCADADPSVFFPGKGDHWAAATAKRICRNCPCLEACRERSIEERFGIWGGLSEVERRVIRKRRGGLKPGRKPKGVAA
jgi:WhiB family transcriptional regulator, redox-sensing transcriptional regulator